MLDTPFSPWPSFTTEEGHAVQATLMSGKVNYWTGNECREFEKEFAAWCGTNYAVAVSNGTVALDIALKALDIGPGDEVVVTPRSFIASVSCVVNAGAVPVFADVDRDTGNLTPESIASVLTERTKAVICVHLAGWPCDMDGIMALAKSRGFKVIEDCAQAHGARYRGRSVGAIGDIGTWSFCQDKIMTTAGEGGMVTTSDRSLWSRMWALKDHGKSYEAVYERQHPPGHRFLHESFGNNFRMLEVQAVVGRIQLRMLPRWTEARNRNARALANAMAQFGGPRGVLRVPVARCSGCLKGPAESCQAGPTCVHGYYKFYAYVRPENLARGWTRDIVVAEIVARGVPCYQGICAEVYNEKAFDDTGWRPLRPLPVAHELGLTSIMWLVHPTLTAAEVRKTCEVTAHVMQQATAVRASMGLGFELTASQPPSTMPR